MIYIAMLHCLHQNDVDNLDPKMDSFWGLYTLHQQSEIPVFGQTCSFHKKKATVTVFLFRATHQIPALCSCLSLETHDVSFQLDIHICKGVPTACYILEEVTIHNRARGGMGSFVSGFILFCQLGDKG